MLTGSFAACTEARDTAPRREHYRNVLGRHLCSISRPNDPQSDSFVALSPTTKYILATASYLFKACPYAYAFISRLLASSFPHAERKDGRYGFAVWKGYTVWRDELLLA
jgi:hypothetical protein